MEQIEQEICCPYCNETILVLVDPSLDVQNYTEDCQVCCHPIVFSVQIHSESDAEISVAREDD